MRYVTNRESFEINSYRSQYDLVVLLSNHAVSLQYQAAQDHQNPRSPVNEVGIGKQRSVHVYSINMLDSAAASKNDIKKDHHNLAEVVFDVIDTDLVSGKTKNSSYNALISWNYASVSNNPDDRWRNWDGFEVTSYQIQPRNSSKG